MKELTHKDGGITINRIGNPAKALAIGEVHLEKDAIVPFISFVYEGEDIFTDGKMSGQCEATKGDCLKWVNQYLKVKWQTVAGENVTVAESHVCTLPDIKKRGSNLFLCPAAELKFSNASNNVTYDKIQLIIEANYDIIKDKTAVDKVVDQI